MMAACRVLLCAAALVARGAVADSVTPERLAAKPGIEQTPQRPSKEDCLRRIPPPDEQRASNLRRDRRDQPETIIEMMGVKPAMRIGEAGAGGGYFTFVLSSAVGRDGTMYANDNDEYMLFALEHYARAFFGGLGNIVPVVGTDDDPRFPRRDLDLIVIYGSFHDFTRREEWLRNARAYLKPVGRLAIVDGYWPNHGALTKDVIVETASRAGLRLVYYKDCSRQYT